MLLPPSMKSSDSHFFNALKDAKQVELGLTGPIVNNLLCTDDVEYTQCIPTIKNGARMVRPLTPPDC